MGQRSQVCWRWQSSWGGSALLERNARSRGKGVITAGLQAALFHPILSEVPEKAFGKARRKYARMSAEIAVGQLE